jgi:hypothetical protein
MTRALKACALLLISPRKDMKGGYKDQFWDPPIHLEARNVKVLDEEREREINLVRKRGILACQMPTFLFLDFGCSMV